MANTAKPGQPSARNVIWHLARAGKARARSVTACWPTRNHPWQLAIPVRPARPVTEIEVVPSASGGASNLLKGDIWGSDVTVTTSRGAGNTLAIAEYAVAGIMHVAKACTAFPLRGAGRIQCARVSAVAFGGQDVCVVGAGGIGLEVGRLCAALGMRISGTAATAARVTVAARIRYDRRRRRSRPHVARQRHRRHSAANGRRRPRICSTGMVSPMKTGAVLCDVAHGEIVDEAALVEALEAGSFARRRARRLHRRV